MVSQSARIWGVSIVVGVRSFEVAKGREISEDNGNKKEREERFGIVTSVSNCYNKYHNLKGDK